MNLYLTTKKQSRRGIGDIDVPAGTKGRVIDIMIEDGLEEEAKRVYPFRNLQALQTVGYKELFEYFDRKVDLPTAIENIKINTRQYAKRQMTWFKKDKNTTWLCAENKIDWQCLDL